MTVRPEPTGGVDPGPALKLASLGRRIFPLKPLGKTPAHRGWQDEATTDPEQIRAWAAAGHNLGILCGEGVFALDVDNKGMKRGSDELVRLELEGLELPDRTYTQGTPTGGIHHLFTTGIPLKNSTDEIARGLDGRGIGGYIVCAGSRTKDGVYTVIDDSPPFPAPEWLVERAGRKRERKANGNVIPAERLGQERATKRATDYLCDEAPLAVEGEHGDAQTVAVARHIGDFGVDEQTCLSLMLEHWNDRCTPPWAPDELAVKVRNAYAYRKEPVGVAAPEADFQPVDIPAAVAPATAPAPLPKRERFKRFRLADLKALPPARWLVHNLIPENGLSLVYGPPKVGKTFWVKDLSLCVASGRDFHGYPVQPGKVLYIAGEGAPARLRDRVMAWLEARGADEAEISGWHILPERVDISDHGTVRALVESFGVDRYDLVVIDTVNRCMSGDENSQADMTKFVAGCDYLRSAWGAAVIPIHHSGKDETKGSRGSTVLRGAIDTGIRIRPDGNTIRVEIEDQKDAEPAGPAVFTLEPVPSGISARLVRQEMGAAQREKPLKGRTADCFNALVAAIETDGQPVPEEFLPEAERFNGNPVETAQKQGVPVEKWRDAFVERVATNGTVARKSALAMFGREGNTLQQKGRVKIRQEFAWVR